MAESPTMHRLRVLLLAGLGLALPVACGTSGKQTRPDPADPLVYGGKEITQEFPEKMMSPPMSGAKAAHALKAGGYHFLEGKQHHYAFTKSETIIQVNGIGPFDITYLDPADDPTKAH